MGKKKRTKADSRGYGSNAPSNKSATTSIKNKGTSKEKVLVSEDAYENLIELLDDLKVTIRKESDNKKTTTNENVRADWDSVRFISKITNLYDKLIEYGFDHDLISEVIQAIGGRADFSIETCLDWFCLNLLSTSLPSMFTEILSSTKKIDAADDNMTVIVADKTKAKGKEKENELKDHEQEHFHFIEKEVLPSDKAVPKDKHIEEEENANAELAKKALLLQQYEYEDEESLPSFVNSNSENGTDTEIQTPEEKQLQELKEQITLQQNDLNDDVANYMRNKYETKEIQKRLKQIQNQAKKLEGKIAKIHADNKRQVEDSIEEVKDSIEHEGGDNEEDDDEDAPMFSLFDNDGEDDEDAPMFSLFDNDEDDNEQVAAVISDEVQCASIETSEKKAPTAPAISKGWTGTTPKKYLEEYCQKQKYPKPKFQQSPAGSYSVIVQKGSNKKNCLLLTIESSGPFYNDTDAKEHLATQVLYELNPTLPLYRVLPPTFSLLWKAWLDEKSSLKNAQVDKIKEDKKTEMKELARLVAPISGGVKKVLKKDNPLVLEHNNGDVLVEDECWEDQETPTRNQNAKKKPVNNHVNEIVLQKFLRVKESAEYKEMKSHRSSLPMYSFREHLLDTIANNQVTVLCAETGAGKTTQCPQFILENALKSGSNAHNTTNIICTQPRRISAISVAERVASETCTNIGDIVGYHIRMESRTSRNTKLLFCTTGVILRRLQENPTLEGVSHVVVDEVHERQWQIDFLLIALRELIRTKRKDLKVILVPGRTFPVASYFLEDLMDATDHVVEEGSRCCIAAARNRYNTSHKSSKTLVVTNRGGDKRKECISLEADDEFTAAVSTDYIGYKMSTRRSMDRVDEQAINYDLIEDVLYLLLITPEKNKTLLLPRSSAGDDNNDASVRNGSVLIFLPGMGEIRTLSDRLKGHRMFSDSHRFDIIPMHSTLSPKDQKRAFIKSRKGCQKIIIATNIAETSITIPDVVCVIDAGLVREVRLNKRSMTSMLATDYCSKASAKQRSGRAGRIQSGICCKLFSSKTHTSVMKDQAMPELQRVPLEEVCLSILAGGLSTNCMEFLLQAPQPPTEQSVIAALSILEEVGAIYPLFDESGDWKVQKLTPLGRHLARLPIHVRLGKMLIFGVLFQCLDRVLTIAATLSSKSPFSANMDNANQAAAAHKTFAHPSSDFLTICNVWEAFQLESDKGTSLERRFCDKYYLNRAALNEIKDARRQFFDLLCNIGFVRGVGKKISIDNMGLNSRSNEKDLSEYNTYNGNEHVVSSVMCAGLYPNIAHGVRAESNGALQLWHKNERVYFHNSSVNAKASTLGSEWIAFYEKFETHRVYIAATSQVNPFALLLFGGPIAVKHIDRVVTIDEWITLRVAAQTGVIFRELRLKIDLLLKEMIEKAGTNVESQHDYSSKLLKRIVKILACE